MSTTTILSMEIDCNAYAFHLVDPYYPECGPDNLVRMAEQYAILIEYLGDCGGHGPWEYKIQGPRDHLISFLTDEYTGNDRAEAEGYVDDCAEPI